MKMLWMTGLALLAVAMSLSACDDSKPGSAGPDTDADTDSDTDIDSDADTDTDSDTEHGTEWYREQCISVCESKATLDTCGGYYVEPPSTADLVFKCHWLDLVEATVEPDGGCADGEVGGRCHCTAITEDGGGEHTYPGCGTLDGEPSFVEHDGGVSVGLAEVMVLGDSIGTCEYNDAGAQPPECICLCPE